jgi:hypothetical protein
MGCLRRLALFSRRVWIFIQPLDEEQVGELLDDFEGVGDAAGPEDVPDAVNLVTQFAG